MAHRHRRSLGPGRRDPAGRAHQRHAPRTGRSPTKLDGRPVHYSRMGPDPAPSARLQWPSPRTHLRRRRRIWASPSRASVRRRAGRLRRLPDDVPGEFIASIYETTGPAARAQRPLLPPVPREGEPRHPGDDQGAPRRFLAYNNGISMTAAAVEVVDLPSGGHGHRRDLRPADRQRRPDHRLPPLREGQGQGGSVRASSSRPRSRSSSRPLLMDLVPRISEFANSQNKVNMADFSANDPFHVEVEKLSRTVWAPGKDGTGAHDPLVLRARPRPVRRRACARAHARPPAAFKLVHPLAQKFTKTDLAKFENTWDQLPGRVARGRRRTSASSCSDSRGAERPSSRTRPTSSS